MRARAYRASSHARRVLGSENLAEKGVHEVSQRRFVLVSADHPIVSAISVRIRSLLSPLQHSLTMLFPCAGECRQVRNASAPSPLPWPCAKSLTLVRVRVASSSSPSRLQMGECVPTFAHTNATLHLTVPCAAQDLHGACHAARCRTRLASPSPALTLQPHCSLRVCARIAT